MRVLAQEGNECFIACGDKVVAIGLTGSESSFRELVYSNSAGHVVIALTVVSEYVFAGYSSKHVCCWNRQSGEFLGSGVFKKRPTAIVYSSFVRSGQTYKAILVSDKTGDVWGSDVPLLKNQTIMAGHTASIITDMTIDQNLIATSDRDEKIRVSRFPDMETIVSYCLHHTSVVSSINYIKVAGSTLLMSTSWDHQLCMWNPSTGKLVTSHQYPMEASEAVEEDAVEPESSSSASAPVAAAAGTSEPPQEGDDEEPAEKTYDESTAGHYPCKVSTTVVGGRALAAVIFKNSTSLQLHSVEAASIAEGVSVELAAVPSDIIFVQSDRLVVLLPVPHFMAVYQISSSGVVSASEVSGQYGAVEKFKSFCSAAGLTFLQVVDQIDADAQEEKGE